MREGVFRHAPAAVKPQLTKRGDTEKRIERRSGVEEYAWGLLTLSSPGTGAFVGIDQVNAGAPILAWLGEAFIDLIRAVGPHISWHALRESQEEKESRERKKEAKVNQCLT